MLAASAGFNILLFLHILAVITAFGPLLVMGRQWAFDPEGTAKLYGRVCLPALVAVWVLGMGVIGTSGSGDEEIAMSDTWVVLSLVAWVVLLAVGVAVILPALRASGDGARSRLMAGVGASHLLMVVALLLMVFQPGG